MLTKHALATCLEQHWSAECAEFASIEIELVIGILLSPANTLCLMLWICKGTSTYLLFHRSNLHSGSVSRLA